MYLTGLKCAKEVFPISAHFWQNYLHLYFWNASAKHPFKQRQNKMCKLNAQSAAIIVSALAVFVNGAGVSSPGLPHEDSKVELKLKQEQVEIFTKFKKTFVHQLDELIARKKSELSISQKNWALQRQQTTKHSAARTRRGISRNDAQDNRLILLDKQSQAKLKQIEEKQLEIIATNHYLFQPFQYFLI